MAKTSINKVKRIASVAYSAVRQYGRTLKEDTLPAWTGVMPEEKTAWVDTIQELCDSGLTSAQIQLKLFANTATSAIAEGVTVEVTPVTTVIKADLVEKITEVLKNS
jgi:hypothetical protein